MAAALDEIIRRLGSIDNVKRASMAGYFSNALDYLMTSRTGSLSSTSDLSEGSSEKALSVGHLSGSSNQSTSSKTKTIIIVAVVVGLVVLLLSIACCVTVFLRRRNASRNRRRERVAGRGWQKVDREERLDEAAFPTNTAYNNSSEDFDPIGKDRLLAGSPQPQMAQAHHAGENTGLMYEPYRPMKEGA